MKKIKVEKPTKKKLEELDVTRWGTWECEPSTFPWEYDADETCYILEGNAEVTTPDQEVKFGKGDLVTFPKGLKCTWKIANRIRKHYRFS